LLASVLVNEAFLEDGFGDFCDGYGGGMASERILDIMKESRLGPYGTVGHLAMLATKYTALLHLPPSEIFGLLIAGHSLSRLLPVLLVRTTPYIREDALSKAKPIGNEVNTVSLWIASLTSLTFLLLL